MIDDYISIVSLISIIVGALGFFLMSLSPTPYFIEVSSWILMILIFNLVVLLIGEW